MSSDPIPVLWLYGPPGVGKTTVGWELYSQLARAGTGAGYVDIDQLGICYPEPASDPGRYRMKEQNLDAVAAGFRASGARCVVVSGVVDPAHGVRLDLIPHAALTLCRLRAGHDELGRRFIGRLGSQSHQVEAVLSEAAALDAGSLAGVCVDTSGLAVAEVARLVRERTGGWPRLTGRTGPSDPPKPAAPADRAAGGVVLWLCGPTGVGKSTVGWRVYEALLRAGTSAAFVDLDQVGFCRPAPADDPENHRLKARNLAATWQVYRAAGATRLVVVGPVRDETAFQVYADALPAAELTLCRLHAGRDQLRRRILLRGQGGSWPAPGDPLKGQPTARLLRVADEAAADAAALERAGIGDVCIPTDGRTVDEVAQAVGAAVPG